MGGWHIGVEKGVYSGTEGWILGGWHIGVENGAIFWEGGVDSGRDAYSN